MRKAPAPMDAATRFVRSERGAITVDWAVLSAAATAMALATAAVLGAGTTAFENNLTADLRSDVREVESVSTGGSGGAEQEAEEFGFAGIGLTYSTSTSRVECGALVPDCGASTDTTQHEFLMSDGSVWTRVTTTPHAGGEATVRWYDAAGQETFEVPEMPEDLDTVVIN